MTDILGLPADFAARHQLAPDIGGLCKLTQGLLIHDHASEFLYGDAPAAFSVDRTTRSVAERVRMATEGHALPLGTPRPPFERQVGTCRDYAAMLCAFARAAGFEARVRCGFAGYFVSGVSADHWVVEHRRDGAAVWSLADAQLDEEHRRHYRIDFDPANVPPSRFLSADRAWRLWRANEAAASDFRHGDFGGEGLLLINLVRDALALADVLTSGWDRWRELPDLSAALDPAVVALGDRLAAGDGEAIGDIGRIAPFDRFGPSR